MRYYQEALKLRQEIYDHPRNDNVGKLPVVAVKDSLAGKSGTWFVSLDTVITMPAGGDPDSDEFRYEARRKLMAERGGESCVVREKPPEK